MKIGKLPESVLKRSVFKQIHTRRPEVVLGAGVGEDCAAIKLAEDETLVMSQIRSPERRRISGHLRSRLQ